MIKIKDPGNVGIFTVADTEDRVRGNNNPNLYRGCYRIRRSLLRIVVVAHLDVHTPRNRVRAIR